MAEPLIPLFPLPLVLLPNAALPLHIFEDRYREMMGEIIPAHAEFGMVLCKDQGIVNIGCTATVEQVVRRYPDGRLDIVAVGRRRFTVVSLNDDKSYLRATVEFFNDEQADDVPAELRSRAIHEYRQLRKVVDDPSRAEAQLDQPQMSFELGGLIDDTDKRQSLLGIRSEVKRLEYLVSVLPQYTVQQRLVRLARRTGPRNGHAKHILESS
jgi:ATP-dependent Lon protease